MSNKTEYTEKLKKTIQSLFKQCKSGCNMRQCINKHCKNSRNYLFRSQNMTDKELLATCVELVRKSENLDTLICIDFNTIEYKSKIVEKFGDWNFVFSKGEYFSPEDVKSALNNKKLNEFNIFDEIVEFNSVISFILKNYLIEAVISNKPKEELLLEQHHSVLSGRLDKEAQILLAEYLLSVNFNFVNFNLISDNFYYNISKKAEINQFFENFAILVTYNKVLRNFQVNKPPNEEFFTNLFTGYIGKKEIFESVVSSFQNFLTIVADDLTQEHKHNTEDDIKILIGLLRLFQLYYYANYKYKFANKDIFHNECVNTYLDIKSQCVGYFKYHHNKNNELNSFRIEALYFSFIKYYFLYDSGSKKEIINHYNAKVQYTQLNNIISNSFLGGVDSLFLNFKVKRNDLIKTALDFVIGNHNFRRPLKVSF